MSAMSDTGEFADWPGDGDGPDDSGALEAWVFELQHAVDVFGVTVFEPGTLEGGAR